MLNHVHHYRYGDTIQENAEEEVLQLQYLGKIKRCTIVSQFSLTSRGVKGQFRNIELF